MTAEFVGVPARFPEEDSHLPFHLQHRPEVHPAPYSSRHCDLAFAVAAVSAETAAFVAALLPPQAGSSLEVSAEVESPVLSIAAAQQAEAAHSLFAASVPVEEAGPVH